MEIEIGLGDDARNAIAKALEDVLVCTYQLYGQTHAYHWNVEGPNFQSLHTLFEAQYRDLWDALDEIAERIRALGHYAPGNLASLVAAQDGPGDNEIPSADVMVKNLAKGQQDLARRAKATLKIAEDHGDPSTVDLLTIRAQSAEKAAWMLRATAS